MRFPGLGESGARLVARWDASSRCVTPAAARSWKPMAGNPLYLKQRQSYKGAGEK